MATDVAGSDRRGRGFAYAPDAVPGPDVAEEPESPEELEDVGEGIWTIPE
ncbi:hypothetical protein [Streptomyces abyssalis]|nr:hypothetical protein [Streptomyces abyssalis]